MLLVQQSIINVNRTIHDQALINKYKLYIFNLNEPTDQIIEKAQTMGTKFENRKNEFGRIGPQVFLHTLQNINKKDKTKYNTIVNFFNVEFIRIYNTGDQLGWRDVTPYEYPIYKSYISEKLNEIRKPFDNFNVYGIYFGGIFRLVDNRNRKNESEIDRRNIKNGKICSLYTISQLIDIIASENIPFPSTNFSITVTNNESMTNILNSRGITLSDPNSLKYIYEWSSLSNEQICTSLFQWYKSQNKIMNLDI